MEGLGIARVREYGHFASWFALPVIQVRSGLAARFRGDLEDGVILDVWLFDRYRCPITFALERGSYFAQARLLIRLIVTFLLSFNYGEV